jgi:hypothetical protein
MIGSLPTALEIGGKSYPIRTDYRIILNSIFAAFNDPNLTDSEKCYVCLKCLYVDCESIPQEHLQEAIDKAYWFVGGGDIPKEEHSPDIKVIDWEQDEHMIFPEVNKVAGREVRALPYLHWWTFLGYFNAVGEGLLSAVISIRSKKARHKKLEKYEEKFYREHKNLIRLKVRKSDEEIEADKEDDEFINSLIGGGDSGG